MESLCIASHLSPAIPRLSPANLRLSSPTSVKLPRSGGGGVGLSSGASVCHRTAVKCSSSSEDPFQEVSVSKEAFLEAARHGNVIPLHTCIFSDHLTPVLAYRCLVKEGDRECPSFLFESVEPGLRSSTVGRYSAVGAQPAMEVTAKESKVTIVDHRRGMVRQMVVEDPTTVPSRISKLWKPQLVDQLPDTFCGGWVGFFSYDTVRFSEKKSLPFSQAPHDDREIPDIHLGLFDDCIVFDHVDKKAYVIHWVQLDQYPTNEKAYSEGLKRLDTLLSRVYDIETPKLSAGSMDMRSPKFGHSVGESNMTREEYTSAVARAKEHIQAGDIFQIVLSQRFEKRTFADPFEIYRALRVTSPSPYMVYLQAKGSIHVASSSEILTQFTKGRVVNKPLAGTLRRGSTEREDLLQERALLNNKTLCTEHITLVDVARNDIGKVAKPGSVNVEETMKVERSSHVMHISSKVTGKLLDNLTCWDALRAALPVGTVSGAPKVRAMELIDELEPVRRGPYGGGLGCISFLGDMDIALALSTMVFSTGPHFDTMYSYKGSYQRQEWVTHLQAGARIVADSNPDDEYEECENKAASMVKAIELAEAAFVERENEEEAKRSSVRSHVLQAGKPFFRR